MWMGQPSTSVFEGELYTMLFVAPITVIPGFSVQTSLQCIWAASGHEGCSHGTNSMATVKAQAARSASAAWT